MAKTKKIAVNTYDVKVYTLNGIKTPYYNCPNRRCINSAGHNIGKYQKTCQECGAKLDWKYLKK